MSQALIKRPLPSHPRMFGGLLLGAFVPYVLFFALVLEAPALGKDIGAGLLMFLVLAGQALIVAVPVGLSCWPSMKRPLLECMLIAAVTGPGPLGYLAVLFVAGENPPGGLWLMTLLAAFGALGGAIFWFVATARVDPLK